MPRSSPSQIELSDEERSRLAQVARRYTAPYCEVVRAKIVLLASEGRSNTEIAQRLDLPREVVCRWRQRYLVEGIDGLADRVRSGRRPTFSPSRRGPSESLGL